MQRKNVSFEQLSDIMAFRIIVDDVPELLPRARRPAQHLFRGSRPLQGLTSRTPKPNGYRSLHTGVIGPERQRIEIQIRTHEMHDIAERGVAAHWIYKQGGDRSTDGRQYRWLRELLDILEQAPDPEEFLEHTKLEMFQDQVFCFTPKGDLIALPRGATPVDFAYAVHPRSATPASAPRSTAASCRCARSCTTATRSRSSPRRRRRRRRPGSASSSPARRAPHPPLHPHPPARAVYPARPSPCSTRPSSRRATTVTEKALDGVRANFKQASTGRPVAAVGEGLVAAREVLTAVYPGLKQPRAQEERRRRGRADLAGAQRAAKRPRRPRQEGAGPIAIRGLIPGMAVHFARCCHPLPGDRIVGIITTGKGVTIHTIDCATLESFADAPERWIDVGWDPASERAPGIYTGRLKITVLQPAGQPVEPVDGDRRATRATSPNLRIVNRSMDFFDMVIDVEVGDVKHLADIIAALRATPAINAVERARS